MIRKIILCNIISFDYNMINVDELKKYGVGLTMCTDNTYTPFHIDSVSSKLSGGGWVYLNKGCKQWNLIEFLMQLTIYIIVKINV